MIFNAAFSFAFLYLHVAHRQKCQFLQGLHRVFFFLQIFVVLCPISNSLVVQTHDYMDCALPCTVPTNSECSMDHFALSLVHSSNKSSELITPKSFCF